MGAACARLVSVSDCLCRHFPKLHGRWRFRVTPAAAAAAADGWHVDAVRDRTDLGALHTHGQRLGGTGWLGLVSWGSTYSFTLTAIPLFVLMAELMLESGLSQRVYRGPNGIILDA